MSIAAASLAVPASRAASAFDGIIAPIFQARCVECHGEQKQKAKLALHSWESIGKGSDGGPVLISGKPGESVLLKRMQLPREDEDHMPPTDHPQPAADEIALIARWIERGASPSMSVEELQLSPALAETAAQLPAKLAALARAPAASEALWEFDAAAVERARAPLADRVSELQRRFPGALTYESRTSAVLHFTAAGFGTDFTDAELAQLAPLHAQLVVLDVARTGVSDASAVLLARLTKLRVFRAAGTNLGDATVEQLATLPMLKTLSLSATRVTPASVVTFARFPALISLRVADTAAERAAQAANLPVQASAADLLLPVEAPLAVPPAPEAKNR